MKRPAFAAEFLAFAAATIGVALTAASVLEFDAMAAFEAGGVETVGRVERIWQPSIPFLRGPVRLLVSYTARDGHLYQSSHIVRASKWPDIYPGRIVPLTYAKDAMSRSYLGHGPYSSPILFLGGGAAAFFATAGIIALRMRRR